MNKDVDILGVDRYPSKIDLRHIEILPEYQGRGIGTTIIRDILEEARRANIPVTLMVLNLNARAHKLWQLVLELMQEAHQVSCEMLL